MHRPNIETEEHICLNLCCLRQQKTASASMVFTVSPPWDK